MKKQITVVFLILLLLGVSSCATTQAGPADTATVFPVQTLAAPSQEATADLFAMDAWPNLSAYGPAAEDALAAVKNRIRELESL